MTNDELNARKAGWIYAREISAILRHSRSVARPLKAGEAQDDPTHTSGLSRTFTFVRDWHAACEKDGLLD